MESTSTGCNQFLSLAKVALKVPPNGRNRSLVARTSRCGECVSILRSFITLPSVQLLLCGPSEYTKRMLKKLHKETQI